MKKYVIWGSVLVLAGIYFLLSTLFYLPDALFLCFLGLCFLVARFATGKYGFTIPGALAFCLGLGLALGEWFDLGANTPTLVLLSLSLGFLCIHLIDFRRIGNWPLIPALILLGASLLTLLNDPFLRRLLEPYAPYLFPALLILCGVVVLARGIALRSAPRPAKEQRQPPRQGPAAPYTYYAPPKEEPVPQPEPAPQPEVIREEDAPMDAEPAEDAPQTPPRAEEDFRREEPFS